jgi:hypothetical protein
LLDSSSEFLYTDRMKNKNNKGKMKLYVWTEVPWLRDWTDGLAFGLGRNKKEAALAAASEAGRRTINEAGEYIRKSDGENLGKCDVYAELMASEADIYPLDKAIGTFVFGGG